MDTAAPADTTDPGPTAWYSAVTGVTLTGADATSGIDHMEWELDGGRHIYGTGDDRVVVSNEKS